jgi:urease accessory protein
MRQFDQILPGGLAHETLSLSFDRRARSRQRVTLDGGSEALLMLPRGTVLRGGDVLAGSDGNTVRIWAAAEPVSTAASDDPATLLRGAYHLGNRHIAVQVGPGWLRYLHDHVLDDMLRGLGLEVGFAELPFEPEAGAYGPAGSHSHEHGAGRSHG